MNNLNDMNYGQYDLVARCLLASHWIYAKTMPTHPHEYTLRKDWKFEGILPWESMVQFIRDYSYDEYFYRKKMQRLNINDNKYWSMGAPLLETILINRAAIGEIKQAYDPIAIDYDDIHANAKAEDENNTILSSFTGNQGSVLDIGCGTGLFYKHLKFDKYTGIDPSSLMLNAFHMKHHPSPDLHLINTRFEEFYQDKKYDLIISMFGAASYLDPRAILRINDMLNDGGKYFLMFYSDDYMPVTYEKSGVSVPHYLFEQSLAYAANLKNCHISRFGNYWILKGGI